MTSTTDPTVSLPTATNADDDDDDDGLGSTLIPGQSLIASTPPVQATIATVPTPVLVPPPADLTIPGILSASTTAPSLTTDIPSASGASSGISQSSATGLTDSLPSSLPTPLNSADPTKESNSRGDGLSIGASAGIGIGAALIVCLAAFGLWFFVRRRKATRARTRSASNHGSDEEHALQTQKAEVYAYHTDGPAEVSGDEKPRRWSELESPTYVVEAEAGQVFHAELPGSTPAVHKGGDERLFTDAPIDDVDDTREIQEKPTDEKRAAIFGSAY